ncbi:DUF7946 domain-containing protein [Thiosulfatihalobacter marinus]|uniref:DUF7946 domain-containing protein n=1 Tax=Thiosulfatihalobacter marinus TaxID=2792481 RepID=UPI0018D91B47|nr:hypothetical protein [Thiosulfatihalobacter marinus]
MECTFELSFSGRLTDDNLIQFYDVSHALWGLERSISLTTHLLLNGEVITQSPSAKGFYLLVPPAEPGSWKWKTVLALGSTVGAFGLAPPDTMFGWLAKSAVEYVVEETLGFAPNFDETLGKQIEKYRESEIKTPVAKDLSQSRFDAVIEKCETGIKNIHRPIAFSESADRAAINWKVGDRNGQFDGYFNADTFSYLNKTITSDDQSKFQGYISSYNSNTYGGRLYLPQENRTIPFKLSDTAISVSSIRILTSSLGDNAVARRAGQIAGEGDVVLEGFRNESATGRLKSLFVKDVSVADLLS